MPLYDYRCKECGEEFEKQLRFADADQLPTCPMCGSAHTLKKLSRVIFLGAANPGVPDLSTASGCGSGGSFT